MEPSRNCFPFFPDGPAKALHYPCTDEILAGLGQLYAADERFRENIYRHGDGAAAYVRDAVAAYCGK